MAYLVFGRQGVVLETTNIDVANHLVSQDASLNIIKSDNSRSDKMMINTIKYMPQSISKITYEYFEEGNNKTIEVTPDQVLSMVRSKSVELNTKSQHPYNFSAIDRNEVIKYIAKKDKNTLAKIFDLNKVYRICTSCDDRNDQIFDIFKEAIKNDWL